MGHVPQGWSSCALAAARGCCTCCLGRGPGRKPGASVYTREASLSLEQHVVRYSILPPQCTGRLFKTRSLFSRGSLQ